MHYIDPIEGWDQSLRRRVAGVAVLVLAAAVVLAGCGGGGEGTTAGGATTAGGDSTTTTAAGGSTASKDAATGPTSSSGGKPNKGRSEGRRHRSDSSPEPGAGAKHVKPEQHPSSVQKKKPTEGQKAQGADQSAAEPHESSAASGLEGASPVTVKKLRRRCPKGMEASACDELVKTYLEAQNPAPAPPQPEPGQCPESLSQAECEAAVAASKAAEKGGSVDVQECLANMTPRCEETLRAAFEAQKQAREGAGE